MKEQLKNHRTIVSNTFFLSVINIIRLLSPFIALPYVIRTIGSERFGEIAFAQSVTAFSTIIVNFGLDVSAVKNVSQNRTDKSKLSQIVSSVLGVKACLFTLSALLYAIIVMAVPQFRANYILFFISFMWAFPEIVFPQFYFQGVERMKLLTITGFSSILFYLSTLFLFVKSEEDYLLVPILQIGGVVLSSFVGLYILVAFEKIKLIVPSRKELLFMFKDSVPFFASRVSIVINQNIAKIVSGLFLGMSEVAAFELAQKIISAALIPFKMFNQAIYPHNANKQSNSFAKKAFYLNIAMTILISIGIYILAPVAVKIFAGSDAIVDISISTLRILIGFLFFSSLSLYCGLPTLVAWGYTKPFNVSVYYSTITLLCLYTFIYSADLLQLEFFAFSLMVVEIVISGYRYYHCRKYHIL